ncbi:MAG: sulfite exporter TauE/SafE family protein [Bryobacteraceae bacterium]
MGVSGTVLFVPLYTMVFPLLGYHLEPVQAVEVSLVTEIFGFMSSVSAFWRAGFIDFQISLFAVMLAAPLAIAGGLVSHLLPGNILLAVIGLALAGFGYLLVGESAEHNLVEADEAEPPVGPKIKEHRDRQGRVYRYRLLNDGWRASAAGLGGILQGLVGFSAGELSTVEQVLRGMPVRIAAGNSHMIIFAAATAAAFTHLSVSAAQGTTIPWNIIAACAPAVLIGGQFAGMLAGRIPQEILRMVLAGFLTFIGLISAYRASMGTRLHIPVWVLVVSVVVCLTAIILVITRQNRKRTGLKACEAAAGSCCSCVPQHTELTERKGSE